jgi:hypothetical protein
MELCESLYPSLHAFEVLLRNAVHYSLTDYYGKDWLERDRLFRDKEWNSIQDAVQTLEVRGQVVQNAPIDPGRLIAELSLGFWTGLFVRAYDRTVAIPVIMLIKLPL